MAYTELEHAENKIQKKVNEFERNIEYDIVYLEIIDDYSNALDVLRCLLHNKNHNIINELLSVSERGIDFIAAAYKKGLEDGVKLVIKK